MPYYLTCAVSSTLLLDGANLDFPQGDPELIYDLAGTRLDRQIGAVDSIDAKLSGYFAAGSALLGLVAAIYAIRPSTFEWSGAAVLAATVLLWASLATFSILGLRPRKWKSGPEMKDVYADYMKYGDRDIKWRTVGTLLRLHKENSPGYETKVTTAYWATGFLALEAGLVELAAVLVAVQGVAP